MSEKSTETPSLVKARERATLLFAPTNSKSNPTQGTKGRWLNLTSEQEDIVRTKLNVGQSLLVEAGAGTGKTSCLIEFARENPNERLLYICFNNKTAAEASWKFKKEGILNTRVSTIHGLASSKKGFYEHHKKFRTKLSVKDIQKRWPCQASIAWLCLETLKAFCESPDELPSLKHFPTNWLGPFGSEKLERSKEALSLCTKIWKAMINPSDPFPLSYDHYLKVYQLEREKLNYDYILLDESQDCNPLALDIVKNQLSHARVILIGDSNQAIYGWRGAKNAMESWEGTQKKSLTESFRFGKNIAAVANLILQGFLGKNKTLKGWKKSDSIGNIHSQSPHTLIARTNSTLFKEALRCEKQGIKYHFVGTRSEDNYDPTGPYKLEDALDVYRLSRRRRDEIRNPLIKAFESFSELEAAAKGPKPSDSLNSQEATQGETHLDKKNLRKLEKIVRSNQTWLEEFAPKIAELKAHEIPKEIGDLNQKELSLAQDILLLLEGKAQKLTSPKLKIFENFEDFAEAIKPPKAQEKKQGDKELEALCRLVREEGDKLPELIQRIRKNATSPQKAQVNLTTAHRSKGLEWKHVKLANDFCPLILNATSKNPKHKRLASATIECEGELITNPEEFNLLYVAITRAMERLQLNDQLKEVLRNQALLPPNTILPKEQEINQRLAKKPTPKEQNPNIDKFPEEKFFLA